MSKKRLFIMLSCLVVILLMSVGYCAWVISHYVEVSPVYDPLLYLAHELHDQETTYDGTAKFPKSTDVPNITYDDEFSLSYKLTGTDTFTNGCPVNAGIYDFKIKCADSDDSITLTFTINKAPQVINASDLNVTYDKQPHQVSATLTTGDGAISYSPTNVTNAGTTVVTITAAETENYLETTKQVNLTIDPRVVTLDWQNTTLEYTGSELVPTAVVTNLITGDTCTVTVSGAQTAPGEYTATAIELSNSNYQLPNEVTHSFLIKQPLTDVDLFELKFTRTDEFMYRLGNKNTVALSSLFKLIDDVVVPDAYASFPTNVSVYDAFLSSGTTLVQLNENAGFNCTISSSSLSSTTNADVTSWLSSTTLKFTGTGIAIIELKVKNGTTDYSKVRLVVEVVDAMNATGPMSATNNNVVLLNSYETTSTISVSNNHYLWGNGFSIIDKFTNTSQATGFLVINNGTIDNVSAIGQIYPETVISGTDNQYYQDSVVTNGSAYIYNSFISGRRSAVRVSSGNTYIYDSTIDSGAYANIYGKGGEGIHLNNVTLIQEARQATIGDTSKDTMGVGIFIENTFLHVYIEGELNQYSWVTQSDISRVPSPYNTALSTVFSDRDLSSYIHTIDGTKYMNLGIVVYGATTGENIHDNRSSAEKTAVSYSGNSITKTVLTETVSAYFYSRSNTVVATSSDLVSPTFVNYKYESYKPTFKYDDSSNYIPYVNDQTPYYTCTNYNDITYAMMAGESFILDWDSCVTIKKYGRTLTSYQVYYNDAVVTTPIEFTTPGKYTVKFVATVTEFYDSQGNQISHTENVEFILTINIKVLGYAKPVIRMTSYEDIMWVEGGRIGDRDYAAAVPYLEYLEIDYYDSSGELVHYQGTGQTSEPDGLVVTPNSFYGGARYQTFDNVRFVAEISFRNNKDTTNLSITYKFTDPWGNTTSATFTWSFSSSVSTVVSDSDFKKGKSSCVTSDTLITLADGTVKPISELTFNDKVLSWDFNTGTFVESDIILLINHGISKYNVLHLMFEDGYEVDFIGSHGLFDMTTMKFEYLNIANVDNYINHEFAVDNTHKVKLLGYTIEEKETGAYSIYASHSGDVIANGMITMTPPIEEGAEFFGFFDVLDNLTFDMEQIEKDIETYGLYDYSVFEPYITYEQFDKLNGKYLKIAVEKGIITWDQILRLIDFIKPYFK